MPQATYSDPILFEYLAEMIRNDFVEMLDFLFERSGKKTFMAAASRLNDYEVFWVPSN